LLDGKEGRRGSALSKTQQLGGTVGKFSGGKHVTVARHRVDRLKKNVCLGGGEGFHEKTLQSHSRRVWGQMPQGAKRAAKHLRQGEQKGDQSWGEKKEKKTQTSTIEGVKASGRLNFPRPQKEGSMAPGKNRKRGGKNGVKVRFCSGLGGSFLA